MGRTKGSKDRTPRKRKGAPAAPAAAGPVTTDHNAAKAASELTDAQQQQLLQGHVNLYVRALKAKTDAAAAFLDVCKKIKGDGLKLADVKTWIELDTPEGEARVRERMQRDLRIAEWRGAALGTQFSMFPTDDGGNAAKSKKAGRAAGLAGEKPAAPPHLDAALWRQGWHEGNELRTAAIIKQKNDDGDEFDAAEKGGSSETEEEAGAEEDAEL